MGAGPDGGHSGRRQQQMPLTPEPPCMLEWGAWRGTWAIQRGWPQSSPMCRKGEGHGSGGACVCRKGEGHACGGACRGRGHGSGRECGWCQRYQCERDTLGSGDVLERGNVRWRHCERAGWEGTRGTCQWEHCTGSCICHYGQCIRLGELT